MHWRCSFLALATAVLLNTTLFAEKVLPRLRDIWKDSGYEDHWWPTGAAQGPRARAAQPATLPADSAR